jgi:glycosyltransferase involved in cell wall biosynthesis
MNAEPRIAFFTDSFLELNGVARTSRMLAAFAQRHERPMLVVHAGPETSLYTEGSVQHLALKRGSARIPIDSDLSFDLLLWRYAGKVINALRSFGAEAVHITGPSDIGLLGAYAAHKLRLPLVISWHTNVHQYAGRRLGAMLGFLPSRWREGVAARTESATLRLLLRFYGLGRVLLAPNDELAEMLREACNRPVFLMRRGVDTELFSPVKRLRSDAVFTLGYVGRLTPEKNVRLLAGIEQGMRTRGCNEIRMVVVGAGSEREWLEAEMPKAEFTGALIGESLAHAYANFDAFVFPSRTDTFGNVVLESLASGVPAVVSDCGGPKHIVLDGVNGLVARNEDEFIDALLHLKNDGELHARMRKDARELACAASWDSVFEVLYDAYALCLAPYETKSLAAAESIAPLQQIHPNAIH